MPPNKENNIITSFMIGITIALFFYLVLFTDVFSNSLWLNLQTVPLMFFGCYFIGNIAVGIPALLYHFFTYHYFTDFYNLSKKKQRTIIAIIIIAAYIAVTLIVTYL